MPRQNNIFSIHITPSQYESKVSREILTVESACASVEEQCVAMTPIRVEDVALATAKRPAPTMSVKVSSMACNFVVSDTVDEPLGISPITLRTPAKLSQAQQNSSGWSHGVFKMRDVLSRSTSC